jgi:hypothetical protein
MAILADCCSGETRSRVTDLDVAYATLTGLLGSQSTDLIEPSQTYYEQLVPITLEVLDVGAIDMKRLVEFRKREKGSAGQAIRDLRHRYIERIESYVKTLTTTKGTTSDQIEIKRQFKEDMEGDWANLREALRFARNEAIFSKDIITATVAVVGTIATLAFGLPFVLTEVCTFAGAPVALGGLLGVRNSYLEKRRSVLAMHPMAYLYKLRSSAFVGT